MQIGLVQTKNFIKQQQTKGFSSHQGIFKQRRSGYLNQRSFIQEKLQSQPKQKISVFYVQAQVSEAPLKKGQVGIDQVNVKFLIQYQATFGDKVHIVGNCDQLGNWEAKDSLILQWSEGDLWFADTVLPKDTNIEFKYAIIGSIGEVLWEEGPNKQLEVGDKELSVRGFWNQANTLDVEEITTTEISQTDETVDQQQNEQTKAEEQLKEQQKVTSISFKTDNGNQLEGENGNHEMSDKKSITTGTIDRDSLKKESNVDKNKNADLELEKSQEEDLQTAQQSKEEQESQKQEVDDKDKIALEAQSEVQSKQEDTGITSEQKQETKSISQQKGQEVEQATDVVRLIIDEQLKPAVEEVITPVVDQVTTNKAESDEPASDESVNTDIADSTASKINNFFGLLAVLTVALSENTLYQTGCGLPPGPYGLYGAAEGVSYLYIVGYTLNILVNQVRKPEENKPFYAKFTSILAVSTLLAGAAVLYNQVQTYGYIPSTLPDSKCFPTGDAATQDVFLPFLENVQSYLRQFNF